MMGTHHAITGAAAWVAVTSTITQIPTFGWYPLDAAGIAIGAVVCAGAALLPDADHHNATIAHSLPGVGKAATAAIGAASGGHRHGTHSGISAIAVLLGALIIMRLDLPTEGVTHFGSAITAAALLAFSVKVLKIVRSWPLAWLVGIALSGLITAFAPEQWAWLPLCIAVGWITHLAGDFLTTGGLPLLWPFKLKAPKSVQNTPIIKHMWSAGGYFAFPILGNTGSWREWLLMVPTGLYALAGVAFALIGTVPFIQL